MTFLQASFGIAISAPVLAVSLMAVNPVQAAGLTDDPLTGSLVVNLTDLVESVDSTFVDFGDDNAPDNIGTTTLDASRLAASGGSFVGITGGTIKDLPIFAAFPVGGITEFLTVTNGTDTVIFDLLELVNEGIISGAPGAAYQAQLRGIFRPNGQPSANLTSDTVLVSVIGNSNAGFAALTPIPTPALLPGLIALGAGLLRKRKAGATEMDNLDA